MIRSHICAHGVVEIEPAELVVQVVVQAGRPRRPCWPWRRAGGPLLPRSAPTTAAIARRSGRATPRPCSAAARNRPRCSSIRRRPARARRRSARRGSAARPSSSGRSGSVSTSSSVSFSCISCSMRSCSAMIGNCRISIDWIIRGARTCFWTSRSSCPKESRMLTHVLERGGCGRRSVLGPQCSESQVQFRPATKCILSCHVPTRMQAAG